MAHMTKQRAITTRLYSHGYEPSPIEYCDESDSCHREKVKLENYATTDAKKCLTCPTAQCIYDRNPKAVCRHLPVLA